MVDKFKGTCPRGFNFGTSHVKDDVVKIIQDPVKSVQSKDYPNRLERVEALERIKEA